MIIHSADLIKLLLLIMDLFRKKIHRQLLPPGEAADIEMVVYKNFGDAETNCKTAELLNKTIKHLQKTP